MKRVLSGICLLFLLIGSLSAKPISVKAIDDFWVEVGPRRVSAVASYQFHFTLMKPLKVGQWLAFEFPPGTTIYPPLPDTEPDRSQQLARMFSDISLSLKGGKHTLTTTKDGGFLLKLFVNVSIDPAYPDIQVNIPAKAGFVNPSKEGTYVYKIATEAEPTFYESEPFQIVESNLSVPIVSVAPPIMASVASYKIEFVLGKGGALKKNRDYIQISFPTDTKMTKSLQEINPQEITINNIPLLVPPEGGGRLLKLLCPIYLLDASKVVVKINAEAGIKNPQQEGDYRLLVSTSTDTTWEKSEAYHLWEKEPVKPKTLAILSIQITPNYAGLIATYKIGIQFGDNKIPGPGDWIKLEFSFQESPIVLTMKDKLAQEIILELPDIENPSPGSYHLKLSTKLEPNPIVSDKFAILSVMLETKIELKEGILGNSKWYVVPPKIVLTCSDPLAQIKYWFDGQRDQIQLYRNIIVLKPGEYTTTIHFYAVREDTQEEPKDFLIQVDSVPPKLAINFAANPLINPVQLFGKTESGAKVLVDQKPVQLDNLGNFAFSVSHKEIGDKCCFLLVEDIAGNITSKEVCYWFGCRLLFQIGKKQVTANDVTENIVLAPFIKQGVTLIPFRYLGEKLQAKVDFTVDPKTKQVKTIRYKTDSVQITLKMGEFVAQVNNKEIKLDMPPQILQGTTVVPLRFVAEALLCRVNWEPTTQTIKLEYPIL